MPAPRPAAAGLLLFLLAAGFHQAGTSSATRPARFSSSCCSCCAPPPVRARQRSDSPPGAGSQMLQRRSSRASRHCTNHPAPRAPYRSPRSTRRVSTRFQLAQACLGLASTLTRRDRAAGAHAQHRLLLAHEPSSCCVVFRVVSACGSARRPRPASRCSSRLVSSCSRPRAPDSHACLPGAARFPCAAHLRFRRLPEVVRPPGFDDARDHACSMMRRPARPARYRGRCQPRRVGAKVVHVVVDRRCPARLTEISA